jgi:hypothetical protein
MTAAIAVGARKAMRVWDVKVCLMVLSIEECRSISDS